MFRDCSVALPHGAMGLSAVCECGISRSYSLTIFTVKNSAHSVGISSGSANKILT